LRKVNLVFEVHGAFSRKNGAQYFREDAGAQQAVHDGTPEGRVGGVFSIEVKRIGIAGEPRKCLNVCLVERKRVSIGLSGLEHGGLVIFWNWENRKFCAIGG
jgi:hypothetical protein